MNVSIACIYDESSKDIESISTKIQSMKVVFDNEHLHDSKNNILCNDYSIYCIYIYAYIFFLDLKGGTITKL